MMGVFVASFAATTLDTACRLQRYVIQELSGAIMSKFGKSEDKGTPVQLGANPLSWLTNKYGATIFAVGIAYWVASMPSKPGGDPGTGGLILWPLFGATNQLLGGLAFLVILFWMWRRSLPVWFVAVPAVVMLILPGIAMSIELFKEGGWIQSGKHVLTVIGLGTLGLQIWMIAEALIVWPKARGVLEKALPPLKSSSEPQADGGRSC